MSEDQPQDREAQVARLLRAAARSERAPASLRADVEAMRALASRRRTRLPQLPQLALRYVSVATSAAVALAVALVLALGGGAGPSLAQAAALASRGSAAAAPGPDPSAPARLLDARVGSLHFPNWETVGGWRSTGQRTDRLAGREVTTVYYASGSRRLAYSIVSAPVLSGLQTHGEPYATFRQGGHTVVIWQEHNHTCLLSATGMSAPSLWSLAATTFY